MTAADHEIASLDIAAKVKDLLAVRRSIRRYEESNRELVKWVCCARAVAWIVGGWIPHVLHSDCNASVDSDRSIWTLANHESETAKLGNSTHDAESNRSLHHDADALIRVFTSQIKLESPTNCWFVCACDDSLHHFEVKFTASIRRVDHDALTKGRGDRRSLGGGERKDA